MIKRSSVPTKVVLGSAGHRAWLFTCFRDALNHLGISGEVIALGHDPRSPGFQAADRGIVMPAYNSEAYVARMREWFGQESPALFLSLNDYEHMALADGLGSALRSRGCAVGGVTRGSQVLLDKYLMAGALACQTIQTPVTHLGSQSGRVARLAALEDRFVVKHRFGSGSSGLQIVPGSGLTGAVASATRNAVNERGIPAPGDPDMVVIQVCLNGLEYGVDGIYSLGEDVGLLGVLARRKLRMRGGDTDRALTVDSTQFIDIVARVGKILDPRGAIDIDVIVDENGEVSIIDINPRIGGGYPFMHVAGARIPSALIQSALGVPVDRELLSYELGVTSARLDAFTVVGRASDDPATQ